MYCVVLGFFSCLNDHNYEVTHILKVPITTAPGRFIKKKSCLARQRSITQEPTGLLLLIPHFRCIY